MSHEPPGYFLRLTLQKKSRPEGRLLELEEKPALA
jgi:hypothetical protein